MPEIRVKKSTQKSLRQEIALYKDQNLPLDNEHT